MLTKATKMKNTFVSHSCKGKHCMEAKTHSHLTQYKKEENNKTRQLYNYDCINNNIIGASFSHDQQTFCLQTHIRSLDIYLFIMRRVINQIEGHNISVFHHIMISTPSSDIHFTFFIHMPSMHRNVAC